MPDAHGYDWGTGRRKTSVARVRIKKGTGQFIINGRKSSEYFTSPRHLKSISAPLKHIQVDQEFDVFVNIRGGGQTGQAGAIMMGLGRALISAFPDKGPTLRDPGFLSRDSRMVERKKYGRHKARRSVQFSKR
jgi:small subunit ribosomal protein S9